MPRFTRARFVYHARKSPSLGPLHVLRQFSFGCWVTWSNSSWQEYYKSVFYFNFTKLQFLNDTIYSYTKKLFGTWQFGKIDVLVNFIIQKVSRLKSKQFSQFFWWKVNLRGLGAMILQKVQASVVERQKKKFCYPSLIFGTEDTLMILLSTWNRSRDSTAKRNLSKDM